VAVEWPGLERLRETPGLPSQSLSPAPATQPLNLELTSHWHRFATTPQVIDCTHTSVLPLRERQHKRLLPNTVQMRVRSQQQRFFEHSGGSHVASVEFVYGDFVVLFAGTDDGCHTFLIAEVNLPIGIERRG
jgi:hypothetical protein